MSIVGGLDIHRKQLTFDWVDEQNDKWERGRIAPADREHLAGWLTWFDPATGSMPDEIRRLGGVTRLGGSHGEVPAEPGGLVGRQV